MIEHIRPQIGDAELLAAERVLRGRQLAQGAEVEAFESDFAELIGVEEAVAVANGTVALEIGLQALGLAPGDEVILPSFTFVATANAVRRIGAVSVFTDIDPKTYCIDASTVEPLLTERTKAVIAVHLYGHPADLDGLSILCEQKGLALIEDAAQGLGSSWRGRSVGSFGIFAGFSFYATKNMTTGEGGMITTSDPRIAEVARALRSHQSPIVNGRRTFGTNARMTDISAAIGRVQLRRLHEMQQRREQIAASYDRSLMGSITTPYVAPDASHGYHLYTVRSPHRSRLSSSLEDHGVGYGIYYDQPCHLRDEHLDARATLPQTEAAAEEVLSLPIRPDLTDDEVEAVIAAVNATAQGVGKWRGT